MMRKIVHLHASDNVFTCLADLQRGDRVETPAGELEVQDAIPFAHKIAAVNIAQGTEILKYGEVIGRASQPISPGEWVHVHNVESVRARGDIA